MFPFNLNNLYTYAYVTCLYGLIIIYNRTDEHISSADRHFGNIPKKSYSQTYDSHHIRSHIDLVIY